MVYSDTKANHKAFQQREEEPVVEEKLEEKLEPKVEAKVEEKVVEKPKRKKSKRKSKKKKELFADVNKDGKVDVLDVVEVVKGILKRKRK